MSKWNLGDYMMLLVFIIISVIIITPMITSKIKQQKDYRECKKLQQSDSYSSTKVRVREGYIRCCYKDFNQEHVYEPHCETFERLSEGEDE